MHFAQKDPMAPFSISWHHFRSCLDLERGRYVRPRKPPEDRICRLCNKQAETEIHFMIFCSHYLSERDKLFRQIHLVDKDFVNLSCIAKFEFMMTSKCELIIKSVMEYLYYSFKIRKETLGKK